MKRTVLNLRVSRRDTDAETLLWDTMYFTDDEEFVKRMFPVSLVIPMESSKFGEKFRAKLPDLIRQATTYSKFGMQRSDEKHESIQRMAPGRAGQLASRLRSMPFAVVPILMHRKKRQKGGDVIPAYITNNKHYSSRVRKKSYQQTNPFPIDTAYINLEGYKVQPICMMCCNSLKAAANECSIGTTDCYEKLVFNSATTFSKRYVKGRVEINEDFKNLEPDATPAEVTTGATA